jgi:hypothetical protein
VSQRSKGGDPPSPTRPVDARDEVDRLISRSLRAARAPRRIPAPSPSDPSDDALLRFLEGSASADEHRAVDEAARASRYTRDRIDILEDALREAAHAAAPDKRAARYVIAIGGQTGRSLRCLRGAHPPWSPAAPAAPAALDLRHPFPDDLTAEIHLALRAQPDAVPAVDVTVRLCDAAGAPIARGRVTVRRGGSPLDRLATDGDGRATLTGLEPARYQLDLERSAERHAGKGVDTLILDLLAAGADLS